MKSGANSEDHPVTISPKVFSSNNVVQNKKCNYPGKRPQCGGGGRIMIGECMTMLMMRMILWTHCLGKNNKLFTFASLCVLLRVLCRTFAFFFRTFCFRFWSISRSTNYNIWGKSCRGSQKQGPLRIDFDNSLLIFFQLTAAHWEAGCGEATSQRVWRLGRWKMLLEKQEKLEENGAVFSWFALNSFGWQAVTR
jgi:hypothetical protein